VQGHSRRGFRLRDFYSLTGGNNIGIPLFTSLRKRMGPFWGERYLNINNIERGINPTLVDGRRGFWRRGVLRQYCNRRLTKPTDKLVALSAITTLFQTKFRYHYLARLWREDSARGLSWSPALGWRNPKTEPWSSVESFYALTWSCVSVRNVNFDFYTGLSMAMGKELVRILEATASPSTSNPFGGSVPE
jgi:hypothetical protein